MKFICFIPIFVLLNSEVFLPFYFRRFVYAVAHPVVYPLLLFCICCTASCCTPTPVVLYMIMLYRILLYPLLVFVYALPYPVVPTPFVLYMLYRILLYPLLVFCICCTVSCCTHSWCFIYSLPYPVVPTPGVDLELVDEWSGRYGEVNDSIQGGCRTSRIHTSCTQYVHSIRGLC